LARLQVPAEQQDRLAQELSDILEYMDHLRELDTDDVEPLIHVLDVKNAVRPDRVGETLDRAQALANAPDKYYVYFRVPGAVDKDQAEPGVDEL
jgi:aspartyl-tRNA(Asn)/glutamyl-tRNA(Gln) amidotransferase subunit C